MKKRKGRIAQLLVMSVITLAMALSIYRNPEHESLVVLLLLWCYFGWNLWTTQQLAKSRSEAVVELERSTVLIRCVTELSSHEDMDRAINNLLKIVTEYFEGDRSYIVKVDYAAHRTRGAVFLSDPVYHRQSFFAMKIVKIS